MGRIIAALALGACASQDATVEIEDGTWSANTYIERLKERFPDDDISEDMAASYGPMLDLAIDLRQGTGVVRLRNVEIAVTAIDVAPPTRWTRSCSGLGWTLGLETQVRTETLQLSLDRPTHIHPDLEPVIAMELRGMADCDGEPTSAQVETIEVDAMLATEEVYSLAVLARD